MCIPQCIRRRRSILLLERIRFLLAVAMLLGFAWPAPAQTPAASPTPAFPSDAELDALLLARNWNALIPALGLARTIDDYAREFRWLKARMEAGGSFVLALLFARNLWIGGNAAKIDDPAKDWRVTAGMISLYAFQVIVIDGTRCEDRSAPGKQVHLLFALQSDALAFPRQLKPELKSRVVDAAIALEKKTASLRENDDLICSEGMGRMRAGLEKGTPQEVPTPPGQVGKSFVVTPPRDWTPKFVSPGVYGSLQDKERAGMRE